MDIEIVLDQHDGVGVREVGIGQILQDVSVIDGGVAVRHLDVTLAFERREHHEQVGGAVALVLIVKACRALGEHTDYGRLARSAAPTGAGCRHRSGRAGLVGARVAQGPYDVARRASCAPLS